MATKRSPKKKVVPVTEDPVQFNEVEILFVGFGILGQATARRVISTFDPLITERITLVIEDKNCAQILKKAPALKDRNGNRVKFRSISRVSDTNPRRRFFATFICLPTQALDQFWMDSQEFLNAQNPVIVRTTLGIEHASILNFSNVFYVPEYGTEHELTKGYRTDILLGWHSQGKGDDVRYHQLLGYSVSWSDNPYRVILHKLLMNAYKATLFTFKNEAARLYKKFGVTEPANVTSFVDDSVIDADPSHAALFFSGKCLPESVSSLSNAVPTSEFWTSLASLGDDVVYKLTHQIAKTLYSRDLVKERNWRQTRGPVFEIHVLGLNNVMTVYDSPYKDSPAELFMGPFKRNIKYVASQLNPKKLLAQVPEAHHPVSRATQALLLVQPFRTAKSAVSDQIKINADQGVDTLVVFDPLEQLNVETRKSLTKRADLNRVFITFEPYYT